MIRVAWTENMMPHVTISEDTFQRLAVKAAALNISVDELVQPTLDQLAGGGAELPLTGDAWLAELTAWKRDAESRADRYPSGFTIDDSRETIYREREDAQL
jgi:hypothetical protein